MPHSSQLSQALMGTLEQHYHNLGLLPGASFAEVQKNYRDLVMQSHPDLVPDNPQAKEQFLIIKESYKILREHLLQHPQAQGSAPEIDTAVIQDRPSTAAEFFAVAFIHNEDGNFQDAIDSLNAAIRLQPDWGNAYFFRAHLCEKLGFQNRAEADYREAARYRHRHQAAAPSSRHPEAPASPRSATDGPSLESEFAQARGNLRRPAAPMPPTYPRRQSVTPKQNQQQPPIIHLPPKPNPAASRTPPRAPRQTQPANHRVQWIFSLVFGSLLGITILFLLAAVLNSQSQDESESKLKPSIMNAKTTPLE